MEGKFTLLGLILLLMKGCDGIQLCKQYSLTDSSSYTTYFCTNYCCDSVYSRDCCHEKPVGSWNSVRTWSMSKPLTRHRRSSSSINIGIIMKYVGIAFSCLILFCYLLIACKRQCVNNTVRGVSSPGNQATVSPEPKTSEEESNQTTATAGPTWQGERWKY
ncbi:uncharacterized protein LOC124253043 [Haliotis rubra]|uniref:uncharacterized protein LOC124253043 n=1 Tax=Haliotis rubra TaxID=36100 RepID=UPI001EE59FA3|nr:uncharacterized protein LOC124253043 [Haliotis rubra]